MQTLLEPHDRESRAVLFSPICHIGNHSIDVTIEGHDKRDVVPDSFTHPEARAMSSVQALTHFVGGPYDGHFFDLDPRLVSVIRLPDIDEWGIENDPEATIPKDCPFAYEADLAARPPCFRFLRDESSL